MRAPVDGTGSGVDKVEFQISPTGDGTWSTFSTDNTDNAGTYHGSWVTPTTFPDAGYDLRVLITDKAGLTALSTNTLTNVTVDNTAPAVTLAGIATNQKVGGVVALTASGDDGLGSGVQSVAFERHNGTSWAAISNSTPFSANWNTAGLNGIYRFARPPPTRRATHRSLADTSHEHHGRQHDSERPVGAHDELRDGLGNAADLVHRVDGSDGQRCHDRSRALRRLSHRPRPPDARQGQSDSDQRARPRPLQLHRRLGDDPEHLHLHRPGRRPRRQSRPCRPAAWPSSSIRRRSPRPPASPRSRTRRASCRRSPGPRPRAPVSRSRATTSTATRVRARSASSTFPARRSRTPASASGTYSYRVVAVSNDGVPILGVPSAAVTVVYDTVAPSAPGGVTATAALDGSVGISWAAASDGAGSGIARYVVRRSLSSSAPVSAADGDATCQGLFTSCADATTLNGKLYSYAVFAVDAVGNTSPAGSSAAVTARDQLAPGAPKGLVATPGDAQRRSALERCGGGRRRGRLRARRQAGQRRARERGRRHARLHRDRRRRRPRARRAASRTAPRTRSVSSHSTRRSTARRRPS